MTTNAEHRILIVGGGQARASNHAARYPYVFSLGDALFPQLDPTKPHRMYCLA